MKNILAFLIVGLVFLCSCENRDGEWEHMKWSVNPPDINKDRIIVPSAGGTYTFICKNYANIFCPFVYEDEKMIYVGKRTFESSWYSIKIDKNIVTVVISSNNTSCKRNLKACVQAGNPIDAFSFEQGSME